MYVHRSMGATVPSFSHRNELPARNGPPGRALHGHASRVEPPPGLSDFLEFAELLLGLKERPGVTDVLDRLDRKEVSLRESAMELRQLA